MRDVVEIGLGKTAQRGYHLDDIAIVPSRRTRDVDDVSTAWQLDAYPFKIPCVAHPSDATMSPAVRGRAGPARRPRRAQRRGPLDPLRGPDQGPRGAGRPRRGRARATKRLQEVYAEPIKPELIAERVKEIRDGGVTVAVRVRRSTRSRWPR